MRRDTHDDRQDALPADRRGEAPAYRSARAPGRRRNPARVLVPVLILATFATVVARQEVPAFADWWARTFTPKAWHSRDTCRRAVLDELRGGRYARALGDGKLQQTQDGPSVTGMRFAVLDENGGERVVEYNCYLDADGRLFKLTRSGE